MALGTALFAGSGLGGAETDAAWQLHRDAAGFSLHKPAGWQVQVGAAGELAVTDPRGSAAAMVRARALPQRADLALWLQQQYTATEPGLYNVRMLSAGNGGRRVAHAAFDYGSNVFQGRASVVAVQHGDSKARLFVAAAARADFAQRLPTLIRILDSVRFGKADAHPLRGWTRLLQIDTEVPDR